MNRIKILILAVLVISCTKEPSPEEVRESSHLKYFGFTLIDTYWDDPTDTEVKTNYLNEVHSFTNIADILVVNPSDKIVVRMVEMNQKQVKSMLHLFHLFFKVVGTASGSGTEYALRTDFKFRWNEFVNTNNLVENKTLIQAFYIGEEPTWNGVSYHDLKAATGLY